MELFGLHFKLLFLVGLTGTGPWYSPLSTVDATSFKLDYLKLADVRTDPIIKRRGLSSHVHSFFGAASVKPSTTYQDIRKAKGNSGNVEENKSLYWYPAIYQYDKEAQQYSLSNISLFSTYYIFETGETTAFPNGFKMIGGGAPDLEESMQVAECVNPGPCPDGDCERWNDFFPATSCDELEMSMRMPSCWDGKSLDSRDHRSHVTYPEFSDPEGYCPDSHPVKLPQIRIFTRIQPYPGGVHLFSDGTGLFHADYMSGWEEDFLQEVLDTCENDSFAAMPNDWCEDHLTFRDAPKDPDSQDVDLEKLERLQPDPPLNTKEVTKEKIDRVSELPGDNEPTKEVTPRCTDPEQETRTACLKLRFKDTEHNLGGRFANRKACRYRRGECQAIDHCRMLRTKRNCNRYGDEAGCFYNRRRRRCEHDD